MGGVQAFPRSGKTQWWLFFPARASRTGGKALAEGSIWSPWKWREPPQGAQIEGPQPDFFALQDAPQFPRGKATVLNAFLLSIWTADDGNRWRTEA